MKNYWLPTIPLTLIEAINRRAAATGSVTYAIQTAHADYNGHFVTVDFNNYRKYWVAEYYWGERVVLCRGKCTDCLRAAHDYYKQGHKGSTVVFGAGNNATQIDIAFAASLGFVEYDAKAESLKPPADERMALINDAFMFEKQLGIPAIGILANCSSVTDYRSKIEEQLQIRK